jgi:glyoxylase-like metal-dependent hydrolase (beta-lactamase superfamily II)
LRRRIAFFTLRAMASPVRALAAFVLLCTPIAAAAVEPIRVATGVYAFIETPDEVASENGGRVANGGFVVGPTGIVVIDAGVSYHHGLERIAAIRRVSDRPIRAVIFTHAMQEFIFGAAAFAETGAEFLTHAKSADLMRARCEHCLENLRTMLGEDAMAGTRLIVPGWTIHDDAPLDIGGRTIELIHPGWASTPGDLIVRDRASGVLFAGGVVQLDRIPELRDGKLDQWVRAIAQVQQMMPAAIVPGYGPVVDAAGAGRTADYLAALDRRMRELYAHSTSLLQAVDASALPAFERWAGYATIHRRNALARYLELEVEDLER